MADLSTVVHTATLIGWWVDSVARCLSKGPVHRAASTPDSLHPHLGLPKKQ